MIECNDSRVKVIGTYNELIKDWRAITTTLHESLSEVVGKEKANEVLTKNLFFAVAMANKKEGEE